jgi:hypothetical protein
LSCPFFSSRPDHYIAYHKIDITEKTGIISFSSFTKKNRIPYVTVAAIHLKLDLPGIATIPAKCLEESGCDHPSLPVILNHLKGRAIASLCEDFDHLRSSIYLKNKSTVKFEKKDVTIEVLKNENVSIPSSQKMNLYKGSANRDEGLAFSFHGHTKKNGIQKNRVLLTMKNKFQRELEIPVEGGYSSFIRLTLR